MDLTDTDVLAAVAGLSDRDEHLVLLKFWDSKTWTQIADLMGCPSAAAASTKNAAEITASSVAAPGLFPGHWFSRSRGFGCVRG